MKDIVVFSKAKCPKCDELKAALDSSEIAYTTVMVDFDNMARDELIEAGFRSVPQVKIDGEWVKDMMEVFE